MRIVFQKSGRLHHPPHMQLSWPTCRAVLLGLLLVCLAMQPDTLSAADTPVKEQPVKEQPAKEQPVEEQPAIVPADTSSPRATLKSFIESSNQLHDIIQKTHYFDRTSGEYRPIALRILDCLDVSELPEYERNELAGEVAVCLKEILDRVELPPLEEIPDAEAIEAAGDQEKLSRWQIPGTRITIARVEEGPRRHEYLFSPGTVRRAVEYHKDVKSLPYRETGPEVSRNLHLWYISAPGHPAVAAVIDSLPDWMRQRKLGMAIWKWAGLLPLVILGILLMGLAYKLHGRLAGRYRKESLLPYCLTILLPLFAMLIPLGVRHVAYEYLTLRGAPLYVLSFSAYLTTLLASLVVVFAASNRIAAVIIASPQINPQGLDAQFIRIVSKLSSIVVVVILFLQGGQYLGIPLSTLLASAGIGGLAIALAAQDTLKTLFGTIMLLTDKPFRVGERIIFNKYDGIIEDIGLRSTKIRLLTGHQAIIPNDELARTDIENIGRRPYIRRIADIHIPLDTPLAKVEKAIDIVRATLENHDGMVPDYPPRVHFLDFNPDSFVIRMIYWYSPPKYWDYLAFSEKVNLAIFRDFEKEGIQFSLPQRIRRVGHDSD